MKNYFLTLIITLIIAIPAFAQPNTLWMRTYGGSYEDDGFCVQQTSDGGYIVAGYTKSYGAGYFDVYLLKIGVNGDTTWTRTFGDIGDDYGMFVQQTSDGGYIIVGYIDSYSTVVHDAYLIKTDAEGNLQWQYTFEGNSIARGYCVQQTSDGGYIIIGYTRSYWTGPTDVYLIKTDNLGDTLWTKTFGGSDYDYGYSVQQTEPDGGYIIAGVTYSYGAGEDDVYLIKTDTDGNQQWSQTFGGNYSDGGRSVQQTSDGGYIIVGNTLSFGPICNIYLIKTDANGNQQWYRTFEGSSYAYGNSVQQTSDGGYIIAGKTCSGATYTDVYLIKTDANGDSLWTMTMNIIDDDRGRSVSQTDDGGYIIAGDSYYWFAADIDIFLIRLDSEGTLVEDFGKNHPSSFTLHTPYPNPFNQSTAIRYQLSAKSFVNLTIYDITGKEVARLVDSEMGAGNYEIIWDAEGLSSGIYFAKLTAGDFAQAQKMVLMK